MTTQEEKIDYIYERLKKQEKNEKIAFFLKWAFRAFIIFYLYFFMTSLLPKLMGGMVPNLNSLPFNIGGEKSQEMDLSEENMNALKGVVENYFKEEY